jgi:hypothetical protein
MLAKVAGETHDKPVAELVVELIGETVVRTVVKPAAERDVVRLVLMRLVLMRCGRVAERVGWSTARSSVSRACWRAGEATGQSR